MGLTPMEGWPLGSVNTSSSGMETSISAGKESPPTWANLRSAGMCETLAVLLRVAVLVPSSRPWSVSLLKDWVT